jgi:hypothetical protein
MNEIAQEITRSAMPKLVDCYSTSAFPRPSSIMSTDQPSVGLTEPPSHSGLIACGFGSNHDHRAELEIPRQEHISA